MDGNQIALVDMDGTLADYEKALYRDLMAMSGPGETLRHSDLHSLPRHLEARRKAIVNTPGWWEELETLHLGFMVLEMLKEIGFSIHILTKGPSWCPLAWQEKVQWCHRRIPETLTGDIGIRVVTGTDDVVAKSLDYGKVLIDDHPPYVEAWLGRRPRGLAILPQNEFNVYFEHPRALYFDGTNRAHIKAALEVVYRRQPGDELKISL